MGDYSNIEKYNQFVQRYNVQARDVNSYYTQLISNGEVINFSEEYGLTTSGTGTKNVPFFSTGTLHSNILDYEFQVPDALLLALGNRRIDQKHKIVQDFKADPSGVANQFVEKVQKRYQQYGITFLGNNEDIIRQSITTQLSSLMSNDSGVLITGDDDSDGTLETSLYIDMVLGLGGFYDGLGSTAIQGVITTIPMYHLSDMDMIAKSCIIAIGNNPKPYQHLDIAKLSQTYYSGVYKILGITHYVDGNKPRSVFEVVKVAPLTFTTNLDMDLKPEEQT